MSTLIYKGSPFSVRAGESVLECLERNEVPIRSSCRAGVCQSCLVQGKADPPPSAQKGLTNSLISRHFFLACQCPAEDSPELVSEDDLPVYLTRVVAAEKIGPEVFRVHIERPLEFVVQPGQFIHLTRPADGLTRSYSIAGGGADCLLELHVARLPGGEMSTYLAGTPNEALELRGPAGDCVYAGKRDEPLLLVGTGTGLAPLLGVVRAALGEEHVAPIHLFHGATQADRLYLSRELRGVEKQHDNFFYTEDVFNPASIASAESGEMKEAAVGLLALVKARFPHLAGYRIYLCGNPELVHGLKRQCFLAGASMRSIHSDPFVLSHRSES